MTLFAVDLFLIRWLKNAFLSTVPILKTWSPYSPNLFSPNLFHFSGYYFASPDDNGLITQLKGWDSFITGPPNASRQAGVWYPGRSGLIFSSSSLPYFFSLKISDFRLGTSSLLCGWMADTPSNLYVFAQAFPPTEGSFPFSSAYFPSKANSPNKT